MSYEIAFMLVFETMGLPVYAAAGVVLAVAVVYLITRRILAGSGGLKE